MGMLPLQNSSKNVQIDEAVAVKKNITAVDQKLEPVTVTLKGVEEKS
jgi:hypothetical protein